VQRIVAGWLAWELTKSLFWVGVVASADLLPVIFIGPFAGVLADRWDRRRILITGKILIACQAVGLAALVYIGMTFEALFALALFGGIVVGVQQPARLAITPSLVTKPYLAQALAINSVIFNLARPLGSALAGVLITTVGYAPAFLLVAASHVAVVVALLSLRFKQEPMGRHAGVLREIAEGVRYVAAHVAIGPIILLAIVGSLAARPVFELLSGFADKVFGWGAGGYTILNSAVGIGAVLAGLWMAQRDQGLRGLTRVTLLSFIAIGVVCVAFGLTGWFWLGVVLMVLAGAAMLVNGTGTQTLIQASVAGHMRGRVLSIWGITFRGGPAIGALAMGALGDVWQYGAPVVIGGALCIACGLWMVRSLPRLSAHFEADETDAAPDQEASADSGDTKS
jgi:MFS family permease